MDNVTKEMEHLPKLAWQDQAKRFRDLWGHMTSELWLAQAWEEIRRNKGSQTPGVDRQTADDVDLARIHRLSARLHAETYRPKPVRRVYIPKRSGKLRPLGMPTIEDRIVQQALRMMLEPIFEADFLPSSHGFRPGRSPHTALRHVARMYPRVTWVIEGDIVGCFDNIPHDGLMRAIERRIADGKVLSLVSQFLKAGYMEDWQYHRTYSGTPQGGIISPLLCNVFLHQLDELMESLGANKKQSRKEGNLRRSPAYRKIAHAIESARAQLRGNPNRAARKGLLDTLDTLEKERPRTPVYGAQHLTKWGYVRYADDFVVLVNGSKQEARAMQGTVKEHLAAMGLQLSAEKTRMTHWDEPITFLGYHIHGELRDRGVQIKAVLAIPKEKERLVRRELIRVSRSHHIPELDAMMLMSAKFRGWCHYYKYANSPQAVFSRVAQKMWWCFAHFLASKKRMSMKQLLSWAQTTGVYTTVTRGERSRKTFVQRVGKKQYLLDVFPPDTVGILAGTNKEERTVDVKPISPTDWKHGRSAATRLSAFARNGGICERCGEHPAHQIHHPNPMATKRTTRAKIMSDKDQREHALALCKECHLEVHRQGKSAGQRHHG